MPVTSRFGTVQRIGASAGALSGGRDTRSVVRGVRPMFETRIRLMPERAGKDAGCDLGSLLGDGMPNFSTLVGNATSCSPFLRSVAEAQPEWVAGLAERNPEEVFSELLDICPQADPDRTAEALRRAKTRMSFLVALADLGGVWPLERVMRSLTEFADFAVQACLQSLSLHAQATGKTNGSAGAAVEDLEGLFVLAMGKMGAFELNYSSDIDLIVLYDDRGISDRDADAARIRFVRMVRRFVALMGTRTADGYVFRTDLRLRPDPLVTPVCMPAVAAERYYESFGRTWERAAFIKARSCAGDQAAAVEFLEAIEPFIWRRNLDFASIDDARSMRRLIKTQVGRDAGGGGPGINLKLGRGGIRDIEMMTQSVQIIAGGRDHDLRTAQTLDGLSRLCARGWIAGDVRDRLKSGYVRLRGIEHRLQMINDAQTHSIPRNPDELARAAALCGETGPEAFVRNVRGLLEDVDNITGEYFAPERRAGKARGKESADLRISESVERWRKMPVLRNDRANAVFSRIQSKIVAGLERSENPDQSMRQFEGFLQGLPAGVQLFSLFESNPILIDLLTDICGTAPGLASYLSRNAGVFDAVLDGNFFDGLGTTDALASSLRSSLGPQGDYESVLDGCRRWMKEHHFQVGVQHLRGIVDWEQAAQGYARIADAVLTCLWPKVVERFGERYGPPPGRGAAVIGMGSLGSGLLTAQSDLDLIVIYDCGDDDVSTGPKPLASRQYYARLTQALVSALSVRTAEGLLYSIDMRLRPSGNKGPVATSLAAFKDYQRENAWTWEHMALVKARFLVGSTGIGAEFERFRRELIAVPRDGATVLGAFASMRRRLAQNMPERRDRDPWEARLGEGRILDIELAAQAAALITGCHSSSVGDQLQAGVERGLIQSNHAEGLNGSYGTLRRLLQVARLTVESAFNPGSAGEGAVAFLLRETGEATVEDLRDRLIRERNDCREAVDLLLSRNEVDGDVE